MLYNAHEVINSLILVFSGISLKVYPGLNSKIRNFNY